MGDYRAIMLGSGSSGIRLAIDAIFSFVSKMTPEPSGRKPVQLLMASSYAWTVSVTQMQRLLKEYDGAGQSVEQSHGKQHKILKSSTY